MLTVKLEDDVVAGLQRHAIPLVDDFNSVIRKLLQQVEKSRSGRYEGQETSTDSSRPGKRERTLHVLLREGVLQSGTALVLANRQVQGRLPSSITASQMSCVISDAPRARQNVLWNGDGQAYSLSALTEKLRDTYGIPLVGGALNGYDFWCLASDPGKTLWELAEEAGRSS